MKNILDYFSKLHPEKFFIFTAAFFGILTLFITLPFQVPDEPNHFYRAWQVSEGGFLSMKQDNRVGGYLPASLEKTFQPFNIIIWEKDLKKIKNPDLKKVFEIPLLPEEKKFYDFNNTAMYSPICYLPSACALFIFRTFEAPPLYCFYAARFASLLFWIFMLYYSIKIIPVYKWLFCLLALLPMSLFLNMSLSADVVTNSVSFLFVALVFKCTFDTERLDKGRMTRLFLLIFLLVSVKSAYAPLLLLLLIIPAQKFENTKDRLLKLLSLIIFAFVFFVFWNSQLNRSYITYEQYNPEFRDGAALVKNANMPQQMDYILHHGTYFWNVMLNSFGASFDMYFPGYIGVFGWANYSLPLPLIYLAYFMIVFVALFDGNRSYAINLQKKSVLLLTFIILVFLVFLSQHLIWDYVGGDVILNIQGRYLIPVMPLAFMLLYNQKLAGKKMLVPATVAFILACLIFSLKVLYIRYC